VPNLALQQANAHALGNSLLILLLIPWGLDFFFYCGEHPSFSGPGLLMELDFTCWHI
jgi:hypothetical protein